MKMKMLQPPTQTTRRSATVASALILSLTVLHLLKIDQNQSYERRRLDLKSVLRHYRDPSTTIRKPHRTKQNCNDYNGILHIAKTDQAAASGSAFFLYVLSHLHYAQMHNLMPFVHFDVGTGQIYDAHVHDAPPTVFQMIKGLEIHSVGRQDGPPGRPNLDPNLYRFKEKEDVVLLGNGIWGTYFEPISDFDYMDESCTSKPLFEFSHSQIFPGMHYCAPWAMRAWNYGINCQHMLPEIAHTTPMMGETMHDWLGKQRKIAAPLVQKHFKPVQWLQEKIDNTNPTSSNDPPCLAIHIRLSDKAGQGRKKNSLDMFLPFAETFVALGGQRIFVASDTTHIFDDIRSLWPTRIVDTISRQEDVFLSNSNKGVFELVGHHRSNSEALAEIYAMSKCGLLIHGYSAMTEAAIYLNPILHDFSINLDYPQEEMKTVLDFEVMARHVLAQQ